MTATTANSPLESQNADLNGAEKNDLPEVRVDTDAGGNKQQRRDKRDVHGWIVLDKPIGMT